MKKLCLSGFVAALVTFALQEPSLALEGKSAEVERKPTANRAEKTDFPPNRFLGGHSGSMLTFVAP
jgi:hypothetical protein